MLVFAAVFFALDTFDSRQDAIKYTFRACVGDFEGFDLQSTHDNLRFTCESAMFVSLHVTP